MTAVFSPSPMCARGPATVSNATRATHPLNGPTLCFPNTHNDSYSGYGIHISYQEGVGCRQFTIKRYGNPIASQPVSQPACLQKKQGIDLHFSPSPVSGLHCLRVTVSASDSTHADRGCRGWRLGFSPERTSRNGSKSNIFNRKPPWPYPLLRALLAYI